MTDFLPPQQNTSHDTDENTAGTSSPSQPVSPSLPFPSNTSSQSSTRPKALDLPGGQQVNSQGGRHQQASGMPPDLQQSAKKQQAPATHQSYEKSSDKQSMVPSISGQPIEFISGQECLSLALKLYRQGISDLHLRMGYPPRARMHGKIVTLALPYVSDKTIYDFIQLTVPFRALAQLDDHKEADYAFELDGASRFRANLFYERGRPGLVLRVIPKEIPVLEKLGLPEVIDQFCHLNTGLVLVTGPTGSGKTTTLAAVLNRINQTYAKHIITVEDPIEFSHRHHKSIITQRELGSDTESYASGIKYALRQDPDVILIGEMRDADTIRNALIAAETGHLVFGTLHTTDAVQTINRVINAFEPHHREPIRAQLADVLRGTVSMRLLPNANDDGRVPIVEVMKATSTVTDYIKKNDVDAIYDLLNQTEELGEMFSLNRSLYDAVQRGDVDPAVAVEHSNNPVALSRKLRGVS
jgi:twitching motility protein PilT